MEIRVSEVESNGVQSGFNGFLVKKTFQPKGAKGQRVKEIALRLVPLTLWVGKSPGAGWLVFYPIVSSGRVPLKLQFRAYRKFRLEIAIAPLGDLATQSFGVVDV